MILAVKLDGSYRWQCDDCGAERNEFPHRGPRHSLCKRCQNIRHRAGRPPPICANLLIATKEIRHL